LAARNRQCACPPPDGSPRPGILNIATRKQLSVTESGSPRAVTTAERQDQFRESPPQSSVKEPAPGSFPSDGPGQHRRHRETGDSPTPDAMVRRLTWPGCLCPVPSRNARPLPCPLRRLMCPAAVARSSGACPTVSGRGFRCPALAFVTMPWKYPPPALKSLRVIDAGHRILGRDDSDGDRRREHDLLWGAGASRQSCWMKRRSAQTPHPTKGHALLYRWAEF
jgi:hypothetical protein